MTRRETVVGPSRSADLLNVAVSRAERRLIVMGDHGARQQHRFFPALSRELPRYPPG
ncbi:hypothetical protein [Streptomyces xiaopingdaonensis]|uniref:hypothetical protein n=1 Tax=Streptomyces xiaopingdaonensis TaxID=1565415 RepID=UPI00138AFB25|nr:hypothetical protein [Streptomyces xiaopingdaonensis]